MIEPEGACLLWCSSALATGEGDEGCEGADLGDDGFKHRGTLL